MTFSTAGIFSQNLQKFIEFYEDIGDLDPDNLKQGELRSEVMYKDDKKYHMDLKENARGRFLKVKSDLKSKPWISEMNHSGVWDIYPWILEVSGFHTCRWNERLPPKSWRAHRRVWQWYQEGSEKLKLNQTRVDRDKPRNLEFRLWSSLVA